MVTLNDILNPADGAPEQITIVGTLRDGEAQKLIEGKWISGRYDRNIRIDRDTHFSDADASGMHAHIYGRTDRDNALVAVRKDGTSSHGMKGVLHKDDARALRQAGFDISSKNIVEYVFLQLPSDVEMLLEAI